MATFQEFHGISLAANSFIENLVIEQLAADPVPVGPGRVWYNTTDKVFRQSTLDATGGVLVRTFSTGEELAASVSALTGDIATLTTNLGTEVTRATGVESGLRTDLNAEIAARIAGDSALDARITAIGSAFNYVGTVVGGASAVAAFDLATLTQKDAGDYYKVETAGYFTLGGTTSFVNAADGIVFNTVGGFDKIDNSNSAVFGTTNEIAVTGSTDAGFTVAIDGVFSGRVTTLEGGLAAEIDARESTDSDLTAEITRATAAEGVIAANLATEVSRATGVEGSLASLTTDTQVSLVAAINELDADLATEVTRATGAESTLSGAIATETAAREAADATLTTNLAAEVTRATAAEGVLTTNLAAEVTRATAAEDDLSADIAAEVTARQTADTGLDTRITTLEGAVAGATGNLADLLTDAKTTLVAAINEVQTEINAEVTRATTAEDGLTSALAAEVTARQAGDNSLTSALAVETTARQAADTTLTTNLAAEVTAREAADAGLQSAINTETSARQAADTAMSARIDALGNAFNYVGGLTGGADVAGANDLSGLPTDGKNSGDYYKVLAAGYFKVGTESAFYANVGDGLVWNTFGGVDKIDNSDSNVQGTIDYIAVSGSADTGFVVDVDSAFKTRVSTIESGLASEITARANAIDTEASTRSAADATLTANLDAEKTARNSADAALTDALAVETTARQSADTALQDAIDAEASTRAAADATLTSNLADEVTRATAAEGVLTTNLAAEKTAREATDAVLTADLAAEVTARTSGDAALQTQLGTLGSLTTTDKSSIVSAINEVKALAGDGVSSLVTQLNSYRYTTTTVAAATSHTITHNLNSTLVDVCVWIDRGDGIWRNDMAAVSILDVNSIKVDLTAARNVRVTVEKMVAFA